MSNTARSLDETIDPLAEWGTQMWDDTLLALDRMTKQAKPTGLLGRDFQTVNELLNGVSTPSPASFSSSTQETNIFLSLQLAFVITKFKLVRGIELRSNNTKRMGMVTSFFTPTILALESSVESFAADRNTIIERYQEAMTRLNPGLAHLTG
ncbi:uncharacterized protein RAG0_02222 [Rhynchosporium agropyri]|uniref:Uncharacterized protein n=1 Tax=Rhynchosporium agropyri TaxID=914238 RepID=A0A1E1K0S4_9HELO|nr:uncharacterized protein RAG0_02222 [Rhynchosporium agropyri]